MTVGIADHGVIVGQIGTFLFLFPIELDKCRRKLAVIVVVFNLILKINPKVLQFFVLL